jgi:hypothetical protein
MADEYTPNYNFFVPKETDSMADVKKNVTDTFKKIEPRNNLTVIAAGGALPQVGNYEIGDRVFRNDPITSSTYPSNYILVCKDANWGWHWRPIQAQMSPWVTVPSTAIGVGWDVTWEVHPTIKFQIALDYYGYTHWRGCIRTKVSGNITNNSPMEPLKNIPRGIRPNANFTKVLATNPVLSSAPGAAGYTGARITFENTGYTYIMGINTAGTIAQNIWFDSLRYNNSDALYYNG